MDKEIDAIGAEIGALKEKLSEARRRRPTEPISDYVLKRSTGERVTLSELFGDQDDLLVIHNMGTGCVYCTMWADGFVSSLLHFESRAAFVVVSPDTPEQQKAFAESRGWNFAMISAAGTSFIHDLGFAEADGGNVMPGFSSLRKTEDGSIVRTGRDFFGPGDDYCPPWRMFDTLHGGAGEWEPKYKY